MVIVKNKQLLNIILNELERKEPQYSNCTLETVLLIIEKMKEEIDSMRALAHIPISWNTSAVYNMPNGAWTNSFPQLTNRQDECAQKCMCKLMQHEFIAALQELYNIIYNFHEPERDITVQEYTLYKTLINGFIVGIEYEMQNV